MGFDFLSIGDTVVDDFIRLKEATATCDIHGEHCQLCVLYGNKIPFEFSELVPGVGNSANAAAACARLGLKTGLNVHVGDDENGKKCIAAFEAHGIDTSLVVVEPGKHTNYHYVLWYETDRTILIKHEDFDYAMPALPEPPAWIYLSSLAPKTENYHHDIVAYISGHPEVKLAFQPGTFQIKLGVETLKDLYACTEICFCNKEEANMILKTEDLDFQKLLDAMRTLGPKKVVITDGRNGAYAMDESGNAWHVPMYPDPKPPVERTGAGDATASTTVAYLIRGLSLEEALMRGLINSAMVVQEIGAQKGLQTEAQIEDWYTKRPADFKATAL